MLWTEELLAQGKSLLEEWFSLRVFALGEIEIRQIVQGWSQIGAFRAQHFLPDTQGAKQERLCFNIFRFRPVKHCQPIQLDGDIRVFRSEGFFQRDQRPAVEEFGLSELALEVVKFCNRAHGPSRIGVIWSKHPFLNRQRFIEQRFRVVVFSLNLS